ncbi:MAG: hypothetical protein ACW981_05455 [Candidatus Hodarchaeales archaeon]|jgi:hypothetical protein
MIETKITGHCITCGKIYQLNHCAPDKPSDSQIKTLQASEKCPDCIESRLRTVMNFHWTGTEKRSERYQSLRSFTFDFLKTVSKESPSTNETSSRVFFIDCFPIAGLQLVSTLRKIRIDTGLRPRDTCALAIALYESLNEGKLCIITDSDNNWIYMALQLDQYYYDMDGRHTGKELLSRCIKKSIHKNYFIKTISYEYAYDLMDWRVEEEKNYLKDELYERIKDITLKQEHIGSNQTILV